MEIYRWEKSRPVCHSNDVRDLVIFRQTQDSYAIYFFLENDHCIAFTVKAPLSLQQNLLGSSEKGTQQVW